MRPPPSLNAQCCAETDPTARFLAAGRFSIAPGLARAPSLASDRHRPAMPRLPRRRFPSASAALALALFVAATCLSAQEVQHHGLVFERWVDDTFFDGYRPLSYTQKWDIPASANLRYGGVPVNPKATKYRTPVDLGDALRQFDIAEPFMLIIGFWRQEGDTKRFVNIIAPRIDPAAWRKLWGPVTRADLARLDAVIKDRSVTPPQARAAAARMKREPPFNQCVFVLNPKIDSKTQRRLQCSLRFDDVFRHLAPDADRSAQEHPALFGVPFPAVVASKPRALPAPP